MREILFKAKRIDNGEWVEGHLIQNPYMGEVRSWISTPEDKTRLRAIATYYGDWRAVEVVTDTICQYTELTDKNGNKIWENDIVNGHEKRGAAFSQCVVKHNDRKARFDVEAMGCMFPLCIEEYDEDFFMNGLDYEVIGNIFDNADLLKGE